MLSPAGQSPQESVLEYTGERMVPEFTDCHTFWEHIYRYRFARRFVAGRRVLDIASGEGYGTNSLAKAGAAAVIGVDVSQEACDHARRKYGLDTRCGSAMDIPLPDGCVDVVVSFETIEHVGDPQRFVDECRRVLTPRGILVISTPDKNVYSEHGKHNPFHHLELSESEFGQLLLGRFRRIKLYTQRPKSSAWWSLRVLAAEQSWVRHVRGFYRLRKLLLPKEMAAEQLDPQTRTKVAELVLAEDGFLGSLMNPYTVRCHSRMTGERATYLIAVART